MKQLNCGLCTWINGFQTLDLRHNGTLIPEKWELNKRSPVTLPSSCLTEFPGCDTGKRNLGRAWQCSCFQRWNVEASMTRGQRAECQTENSSHKNKSPRQLHWTPLQSPDEFWSARACEETTESQEKNCPKVTETKSIYSSQKIKNSLCSLQPE